MLITIDTDKDNERTARLAIGFIAHYYNLEPSEAEVPEGTTTPEVLLRNPIAPAGATAAAVPVATAAAAAISPSASVASVPPPPSAVSSADTAAPSPLSATTVPVAAAVSAVASVLAAAAEYDSAGMPWDARIHQKAKGKKKDQTWKLIKGIDPAVVQAVTAELAARKIATPASPSAAVPAVTPAAPGAIAVTNVPPPPPVTGAVPPPPATVAPQVFLPEANSVPLPPQQGNAAAAVLPVSSGTVATSVPVPPTTVAGAGGSTVTYRSIIDKMTAGTRENKLTAAKVLELVIGCGCPNLQQLNQMPNVWADVDAKIDLALAGLL